MSGGIDERLEVAIRGVLAESRPVTDAPADLRARIELIPASARPSRLPSPVRAWLSAVVPVAGLAAGILAILAFGRMGVLRIPLVSQSPGGGTPTPQAFDPTMVGPGVVASVDEQLGVVPWLVAILGWVAIAVIVRWVARRIRRLAAPVIAIGLALGMLLGLGARSLAVHPGFEWGGSYGPRLGLDMTAEPPAGSDSRDVWYVTVPKGEPFAFGLGLRNPGPLPIRFLGIVEPNSPGVLFYRWSAVWQHDDPHGFMPAIEASSAFHPIDVASGDFVTLYLVARASECAFGPGFVDEDPDTFGFQSRESILVAYSVLGLTATSEIELPFIVAEPVRNSCPA
ncbi:MAG: hypothetical protein EPO36_05360 [Chloroflexota bacterium]|nr:MAG: hypothetical protein EPO36_05360 [Chloroflexota bacterium]